MLQLSIVPAYALTIHKTQALSIKHIVRGSLEGIFAFGQVYVLISRVTDPANLELIGLPPKDIIEDLSAALYKKFKELGFEKPYAERDAFFKKCTEVSKEWEFDNGSHKQKSHSRINSINIQLFKYSHLDFITKSNSNSQVHLNKWCW